MSDLVDAGRPGETREVVGGKALLCGAFWTIPGMAQNFIACDREQSFLLPPDVREWLPEGPVAWFVIDRSA